MLDKILFQANHFPDRIAIKSDNNSISYSELIAQATTIAAGIQDRELVEKCIGISLKSKAYELIASVGVLLSNNHFFFIPEGIEDFWREQVPVSLLISDREQAKGCSISAFDFDEIKSEVPSDLKLWWKKEAIENKIFCVYCTSGSTSKPKYVVHDYQSIVEDTYRQVKENKITAMDTLDFIFAASFSSSLASIFPALVSGASVAVFDLNPKNLKEIPLFWQQQQVSFATLTSSAFRTLARINSFNLSDFTMSIRFLCLAGEPIIESDLQLFGTFFPKDSEIQLAYASTETRTLSQIRINCKTSMELIHDGFPVRNKTINILDYQGNDCPVGLEGELVVHSPYISLGYFVDGKLVLHEQSGSNRIYRTGDRGFFSKEGSLKLTGRVHSLQKVNGKWVDFNALEKSIYQVGHCRNCKILLSKDENGFDYLIACLEVSEIDPNNSISESINSQIKFEIKPRSYAQFENFPLNSNGKIDKKKLLEKAKADELSTISSQIEDPITKKIHQT